MVLLVLKASKLWHVTGHILYAPSSKQADASRLALFLKVSNHRFLVASKASFTGKKIALGKTEVGTRC